MTLLDDYAYLGTPDGKQFLNKVAAAFYKVATNSILVETPEPSTAEMRFAKVILNANAKGMKFVAKAMVSQGLDHTTADAALTSAIANNYPMLARLYDPTLEV